MKTYCIIAVCAMLLSACQAGAPWMSWMYEGPPNADERDYPPLYVEGWKHGCESGVSAQVNHFYKFKYKFKQDYQLAQNSVYYKGWKDSFDYCQKYINQYYTREFI